MRRLLAVSPSDASAFSTATRSCVVYPCVVLIIWMTINAVSFACVDTCYSVSSKKVISLGRDSEMQGIYAVSYSTDMIQYKTIRNWTNKVLIGQSVGQNYSIGSSICDVSKDSSIPGFILSVRPFPTASSKVYGYFGKKSLHWRSSTGQESTCFCVSHEAENIA